MRELQELAESPEYLLSGEVMRIARISRRTLDRWSADGLLPFVKVGGTRRYRRLDIEALLSQESAS